MEEESKKFEREGAGSKMERTGEERGEERRASLFAFSRIYRNRHFSFQNKEFKVVKWVP